MSDSDSEVGEKEEDKGPQTAGEALKEIFIRILAGLGAVGRGLRGGFVGTYTCVQRTVYPVKESCIYGYDSIQAYFHPTTGRAGGIAPAAEVVRFTQIEADLESHHLSSEQA